MSVRRELYRGGVAIPQPTRPAFLEVVEPGLLGLSALLDRLTDRVVLFRYGEWVFVSFGLFGAVGALLTGCLMGAISIGQGFDPGRFLSMALAGSAAVVVGSWLLGQLFDYRALLASPATALRRPVFVSWGGILGLAAVLALFADLSPTRLLMLLDALARTIFLGHAIGRLGCLAYGCCYGRPTAGSLAITYRNPQAKAVRVGHRHGTPLHPAALYEAILELGLLVAINWVASVGAPLGIPTAMASAGYGCIRFAVEFSRDQVGRAVFRRISLNHLISLVLVALGGILASLALPGTFGAAHAVAWGTALGSLSWLVPALLPAALVFFVGFSLHRGDVGRW